MTEDEEGNRLVLEASKSMKNVLQKNVKEKSACDKHKKELDVQRRSLHAQLSREEKDLRQQLHRLQTEQKILAELDNTEEDRLLHSENNSEDEDFSPGPDEVVNPYPVTIRSRKISAPSKVTFEKDSDIEGRRYHHRRRRMSIEFEDLEVHTSTGNLLPPLKSRLGIRLSLPRLGPLVATDSVSNIKSPNPKDHDKDFSLWVGEPEAISSVRRPRKSVVQQRRGNPLSRSQSFHGQSTNLHKSIECLNESLGGCDGGSAAKKNQSPSFIRRKPPSLQALSTSPECKSTVWADSVGSGEGACGGGVEDPSHSSIWFRRRMRDSKEKAMRSISIDSPPVPRIHSPLASPRKSPPASPLTKLPLRRTCSNPVSIVRKSSIKRNTSTSSRDIK